MALYDYSDPPDESTKKWPERVFLSVGNYETQVTLGGGHDPDHILAKTRRLAYLIGRNDCELEAVPVMGGHSWGTVRHLIPRMLGFLYGTKR